ncbi:accessory Sec system glycosyltransferase Asp1 [Furfurilactobacillus milii]|uniref:Accessory Sec system glycosyltransferase Asp1 n=1 Tax=Furfurilactobacillus milii TaxID=2888272 RepID=A0ABT6D856_9LACO|nr:accessory Sec system glycosyltransferase Asp1 [Furfurilactobacillus milii]MCF6160358.1 accessory Sec system glycosyltransferase Asp1 [Furfurilactobacillus milii]MCF6162301.1 accessory Sec system glycosyltransferase Asp1 [Furfurilactobacillus milii]MDF9913320.1 accessory Sec system glycosyltransferase Asp1 [Furfurilactobacillus milii]
MNEYIYPLNSGIEFAEFKRLSLFKQMNVPAKLVTRMFNPQLHRFIADLPINDESIINMFDFFQDAVNLTPKKALIADAKINPEYEVSPDSTVSKSYKGDRLVNRIIFMAGTYGQLDTVEYFDRYQNLTKAEVWDWRGFKSCTKYYDINKHLIHEEYFNTQGSPVLEFGYSNVDSNPENITFIQLTSRDGYKRYFENIDELFTYFLQQLDQSSNEPNTFIADRPLSTYAPVLALSNETRKFIYLPMLQTDSKYSLVDGALDEIYTQAFKPENLAKLTGIIVATEQQKLDIERRVKGQVAVYALPAATIEDQLPKIEGVRKNQIIFAGRLGNGKGITRLVDVFKIIHNHETGLVLKICGYGNVKDDAKKAVEKAGLKDVVKFEGYLKPTELISEYFSSKLFVTTTEQDVEPLAMTEAAACGLPLCAFDVAYGPAEIINDGKNGILVSDGHNQELADRIVKLIRNPTLLQNMSDDARKGVTRFMNSNVSQMWKEQIVNR